MDSRIPTYLTETQVSKMTGIALSTLRNQRFERRGCPYLKIGMFGRSVRYKLSDVIDYMEARRIQTEGVQTIET